MEIKPTFFSITGFLVPGIVALLAAWILLPPEWTKWAVNLVAPSSPSADKNDFVHGTLIITSLLSVAFVLGSIISEGFLALVRFGFRRPFWQKSTNSTRARADSLLDQPSLKQLLRGDLDAREAYAYIKTSQLDLDWFAGRVRMVGGSSSILILLATVGAIAHCVESQHVMALFVGGLGFWLAIYRARRLDEYVATVTAVYLLNMHPSEKPEK